MNNDEVRACVCVCERQGVSAALPAAEEVQNVCRSLGKVMMDICYGAESSLDTFARVHIHVHVRVHTHSIPDNINICSAYNKNDINILFY